VTVVVGMRMAGGGGYDEKARGIIFIAHSTHPPSIYRCILPYSHISSVMSMDTDSSRATAMEVLRVLALVSGMLSRHKTPLKAMAKAGEISGDDAVAVRRLGHDIKGLCDILSEEVKSEDENDDNSQVKGRCRWLLHGFD